jgi:DnaJ-class molecular chaperone
MDTRWIACAFCKGKGVYSHTSITCTVCHGQGRVEVHGPAEECPQCRGTGMEAKSRLPCLVCGGLGVLPLKRE